MANDVCWSREFAIDTCDERPSRTRTLRQRAAVLFPAGTYAEIELEFPAGELFPRHTSAALHPPGDDSPLSYRGDGSGIRGFYFSHFYIKPAQSLSGNRMLS